MSLSCASAGNCAAGGEYKDSTGHTQTFVADETDGIWGKAEEVPGTASLDVDGDAYGLSLSCASAGNCAASGSYEGESGLAQAFVVDETAGTWGNAEEIPGIASLNAGGDAADLSLSCASAGNCAVAGTYAHASDYSSIFVVNETAGIWGNAEEVRGTAKVLSAGIASVSCRSVGNCSVGGWYENSAAIVIDQTAGTWGKAEVVPGMTTLGAEQSDTFSLSVAPPVTARQAGSTTR